MRLARNHLSYAIFAAAFLFRFAFGIFSNMNFEDQRQIYLIGLKYYCTGLWPYFGPDVEYYVQIPGALQGLLVGLPLRLIPVPESPFILVNILTFAALCLFGWYISRRLPTFPRWLIWGWLFTAPWLLNVSTNVYNVSYVFFGSVIFFIGFLESVPALSIGLLRPGLFNAMMGFAFFWNAQLHLSYVILAPFIIASIGLQLRAKRMPLSQVVFFLLAGAIPPAAFLLPTYLHYGFQQIGSESQKVLALHLSNVKYFPTILARYLSLASSEIPRFMGGNTVERMEFLKNQIWAAPFTLIALMLGILQPILMLVRGFQKKHPLPQWQAIRALTFLTLILIGISFLFTVRSPSSFTFYLTLPIVTLYAFYAFQPWSSSPWFLRTAKLLLVCNLVFHAGVAANNYRNLSFFTYRNAVVDAIRAKDYRLLGERRWDSH